MKDEDLEKVNFLHLYNTESKEKHKLIPNEEGGLKVYTCGPTVYNYAHIGNLRTFVFEDLLRRTMKYFGMKVTQVMNLTDIDDKTIKGAIETNQSLDDFTKPFKEAFFEDLKSLNVEAVESYPCATDYIDQMIKMISSLLDKGYAYIGKDKCVYFRISEFSSYGRLSHLHLDELKEGASDRDRVSSDEYDKENIGDFVLWKAFDETRDGQIFWESPFGKGRPGWHIECSCMATELLGETIDLHLGGVDNIFPHHENEIAQSEACSGKRFVKHWMHVEHLIVEGKKMSKSLGNFFTLRDLLEKGFTGQEIRLLLLQSHYRMQLNFTMQGLDAARNTLRRVEDFVTRLKEIAVDKCAHLVKDHLEDAKKGFKMALGDDMNISQALAAFFEMIREINTLCDHDSVSKKEAELVLETLKEFDTVLACLPLETKEDPIPSDVIALLEKRQEARKAKDFSQADQFRDQILEKGYIIEDTASGSKLKTKP